MGRSRDSSISVEEKGTFDKDMEDPAIDVLTSQVYLIESRDLGDLLSGALSTRPVALSGDRNDH